MLSSRVVYAEKPRSKVTRTVEDRKHLRSLNYRRFLEGQERELDLTRTPSNSLCIRGLVERDEGLVNRVKSAIGVEPLGVSAYPGGVCILLESRSDLGGQGLQQIQKSLQANEVIIVSRDGVRGTLCSLESPGFREYPALLLDIEPERGVGVFKTKYEGEVSRVFFGRIKLSDDYREVSRGRILV
jgi:polynucleotide 5'-kinase involved in rRNA processing